MPSAWNGDAVRAELRYLYLGSQMENTLWFEASAASIDNDSLGDLAQALLTWWEGWLQDIQSANCRLVEIFLEQWAPPPHLTYTLPGDATTIGGAAGDGMAPQDCLTISFRTGISGRAYRGRNYTVGMVESQQTSGRVSTTYYNAVTAAYNALQAAIDPLAIWTWVVCSQWAGGTVRETAILTPVQTAVCVDDIVDTQRRRAIGRGV